MNKYRIFDLDPPWKFDDKLTMSGVKRGAKANYDELSLFELKKIDIKSISEKDALMVLWVPSSLLSDGLELMKHNEFKHKQTYIWVKTKKNPIKKIHSQYKKNIFSLYKAVNSFDKGNIHSLYNSLKEFKFDFNVNDILSFYMGRIFRQTHEIALIGIKGEISKFIENKSQRSVFLGPIGEHSEKPEALQDSLDLLIPPKDNEYDRIELFARRHRKGWVCIGNEAPMTLNEDIYDSVERIKKMNYDDIYALEQKILSQ